MIALLRKQTGDSSIFLTSITLKISFIIFFIQREVIIVVNSKYFKTAVVTFSMFQQLMCAHSQRNIIMHFALKHLYFA